MGAAAGDDLRQLGLGVQLAGRDPIGPHAGRVDHVVGPNLQPVTATAVLHRDHRRAIAVATGAQPGHPGAVGADRAEPLGLPEHGQHQPDVVGLAVVEQVAAGRLPTGQRGQQRRYLFTGDHPMTVRAPRRLGLVKLRNPAATPPPQRHRHHVVHVQPDPDQPVGMGACEGGHDHRQRSHQMRRQPDHQPSLEQRLADEAEIEILQVAQAAMDELGRAAAGARGIVGLFDERDAVPA